MTTLPHSGRVERKLAAIFAADVAGYSRLMGEDEAGTLRTLTAHREVMDGLIAAHGGRIANTAGDSVLAEFPSVVDAVECAVAVQELLREANAGVPEEKALRFRIGVHVGDVMVKGGDLLGDGVNVAARVQALADPGGVWLSGRAYEEVQGKIAHAFEDRGEQQVKNIARPVRAYALTCDAPMRVPSKALALPDKPSIAILPFTNMSGDPEQEYFCDGLSEDIITALSRVKWFFVIARNSSFMYKRRAVDIRQVGRELGVRYVLEGSIRKAGGRLRITGQLIEAATGNHIWADRFDGNLDDVFALQDRVTMCVAGAIEPSIRSAEIERLRGRSTLDLGAYDFYLRALSELSAYTEQSVRRAEKLLRQAVTRDPMYADAWAGLATIAIFLRVGGFISNEEALALANEAAHHAVKSDPQNPSALASAAAALSTFGIHVEEAIEFADRAISLAPYSTFVLTYCGFTYNRYGQFERALELLHEARRLSPRDPRGWVVLNQITMSFLFLRQFDAAIEWAQRNLSQHPRFPVAMRLLAIALAHSGRMDEARDVISTLLEIQPNANIRQAASFWWRFPWMTELFVGGLRKAGLPE